MKGPSFPQQYPYAFVLTVSCIKLKSRRRIPLCLGMLENLVHKCLASGLSAVVYSTSIGFACWFLLSVRLLQSWAPQCLALMGGAFLVGDCKCLSQTSFEKGIVYDDFNNSKKNPPNATYQTLHLKSETPPPPPPPPLPLGKEAHT